MSNEDTRTLPSPLGTHVHRGLREAALVVLLALAAYLLMSIGSYNHDDPGWSYQGSTAAVQNLGGATGAWVADVMLYLFGYLSYLFPAIIAYSGYLLFKSRKETDGKVWGVIAVRWFGFFLTLATGTAIADIHFAVLHGVLPLNSGGILGRVVADFLASKFGFLGATLFLLSFFLVGVSLFIGLSWLRLMDLTGKITLKVIASVAHFLATRREKRAVDKVKEERAQIIKAEVKKQKKRQKVRIEPEVAEVQVSERVEKEKQISLFNDVGKGDLPPISILDEAQPQAAGYSEESLEAMSRQVELKLKDFGIQVEVVAVHPGPVITRFELQPAPGVKVSQITNLAKDLARGLSAISVRVEEVIPGKNVVGLEIPNEIRQIIAFSEVVKSTDFEKMASPLTMAIGKDIAGYPVVVDLGKMPHLLVAGTTGSGKSVGVNSMIVSMLYKSPPEDVRMIMIDPKMLELSVYDDIPHLLAPVVTDMKEAANALRWCVAEMERRYKLMAALGVRNIAGYNKKVKDAIDAGEPIADPLAPPSNIVDENCDVARLDTLPYIVVVVDEFADMMMIVGKKVEELIARLAQKARAAGIHLILATQRPSVDVITGLIKANIPTRIAFQVSSKVDSRTILDQQGAETLLGQGDMLYLPPGTGVPKRVHGAFLSDSEVHHIVEFLKQTGKPDYIDDVLTGAEGVSVPGIDSAGGSGGEDLDPLYDEAVKIVTETRKASVSGVQRRLKVGYNRAARLVEQMEADGVVGPMENNGSREVLAPPPPPVD